VRSRFGATMLGNRDMRLFLAAQGLDSLAIGVAGVALPWLVLSEGHSVGLAGLVYPVTIVPFVVFGLPAGALGDGCPGAGSCTPATPFRRSPAHPFRCGR
jgi:MFS family permease